MPDVGTVGPWVLLALSFLTILGAIWTTVSGTAAKGVWMMWVFGGGMAGVGIYGPSFLLTYSEALKVMTAMSQSPGTSTFTNAFNLIANGKMPQDLGKVAVAYALENPLENMDDALNQAIAQGKDPAGKAMLEGARQSLEGKKFVAEQLATRLPEGEPAAVKLKKFDPATRALVARSLLKRPELELRPLALDPEILRRLSRPEAAASP